MDGIGHGQPRVMNCRSQPEEMAAAYRLAAGGAVLSKKLIVR